MTNQTKIICPECGTAIDVQDVLAHQLEVGIKKKYESLLHEEQLKVSAQKELLGREKELFEEKKKRENALFQERLEKQLEEDRKLIQQEVQKKIREEQSTQFSMLQKELNEQSEKLKELNQAKAEVERLRREKDEAKATAELEAEKKLSLTLTVEREKIQKFEAEKSEMKFRELEKQLEDQKKLTEEMKRKQDQASGQFQGEVQELAIEEWLGSNFPLDTIEEIRKGERGGDCIQIVHTRSQQNCGTIYYESKRTKQFQPSWLEKFKGDMREKGADIGVIVTEVMPSDMKRMGQKEGIWVCNYEEFKGLCGVLRQTIIQIHQVESVQENRGEKMQLLYNYLTSSSFRMQIEAIVEGFTQMKGDLESEKRSMQKIWKQREKQIEKVLINTIDMYGSVKGIAGSAIENVKALELPDTGEPDTD
jgi:hypothetical protein